MHITRLRVASRATTRAALSAVAASALVLATVPATAGADPADPTSPAGATAIEHSTLDSALAAEGLDRSEFQAQSDLVERLGSAADDYADAYPEAFGGVRLDGLRGLVAVNDDAPGADALRADLRSRGFSEVAGQAAAAEVEEKVAAADDWIESLPPSARESVISAEVDDETGDVTVLVEPDIALPPAPAGVDVDIEPSDLHYAQSGSLDFGSLDAGSSGLGGVDFTPILRDPEAHPIDAPTGAILGGQMYFVQGPGRVQAHCSYGFHGTMNGAPVNITAAHCSQWGQAFEYQPGRVGDGASRSQVGAFSRVHYDTGLDAALIDIDSTQASRFDNNLVASEGGRAEEITGYQRTLRGQIVCKYGFRSGYTCGTSTGTSGSGWGGAGGTHASAKTVFTMCVLSGDSGGVIFSGSRAVGVTSMSNAFYENSRGEIVGDSTCAAAGSRLGEHRLQGLGVDIQPILDRFPGLTLNTA